MEHAPGCSGSSMLMVTQRGEQRTERCVCGAQNVTGNDSLEDWDPEDVWDESEPLRLATRRQGLAFVRLRNGPDAIR